MLTFARHDRVRLQNRKLVNETARYPEIVAALAALPGQHVFDGEVVVLEDGRPSFQRVLERELVSSPLLIERRSRTLPATYVAFDLLYADGTWLLERPLVERRERLKALFEGRSSEALVDSPFILEKGRTFFEQAVAEGLEGVVGKALQSPYLAGKRNRYWIKSKAERLIHCVVLGTLVEPGTGRVRSLVLGAYRDDAMVWMGNVGSGLDEKTLRTLATDLHALEGPAPDGLEVEGSGNVKWLQPVLVARVKYLETTHAGRLRAPVFVGFVDRRPESCTLS